VTHPLAPLARDLARRTVRYVLIGVSGANFYGPEGQAVFTTQDFDLQTQRGIVVELRVRRVRQQRQQECRDREE
jgi:hypothetical protein